VQRRPTIKSVRLTYTVRVKVRVKVRVMVPRHPDCGEVQGETRDRRFPPIKVGVRVRVYDDAMDR